MTDILRRLSWAFVSGCAGVVTFFVGAFILIGLGVIPDAAAGQFETKAFMYKQLTWGGIWGFLFVLPVLRSMWWLRGLIVGALASLAALFIFMPQLPPAQVIVLVFVLNAVFWGVPAAWWHDRVMDEDAA